MLGIFFFFFFFFFFFLKFFFFFAMYVLEMVGREVADTKKNVPNHNVVECAANVGNLLFTDPVLLT